MITTTTPNESPSVTINAAVAATDEQLLAPYPFRGGRDGSDSSLQFGLDLIEGAA